MKLSSLVKDWGGFEKLIADLHNTGKVQVQHNVILTGILTGAPRQIDVLITHIEGFYTQRIIVECKYWKAKIKRTHIDAMVTQMQDLNASRAVFFTVEGYQSGAETVAAKYGIDIFVVSGRKTAIGAHLVLSLTFFCRSFLVQPRRAAFLEQLHFCPPE